MATKRTKAATKAKTEALRGKERLQQLMEEFPEVPPTRVVKADLLREGIKPSPTLRQIGRWALPTTHWYFEYDKEDTHTAEDMAGGYILSPLFGHFQDGLSFQFLLDSRSPYEIRYDGGGRYQLYRDGEPIQLVFFPARPSWYDRKTSKGTPMPTVITQRGEDTFWLGALTYCEYFKDDGGCRYCNINPSESVNKGLGLKRVAKRDQDIYETWVVAAQERQPKSSGISGGVILDIRKEADNYARIARAMRSGMKAAGHEVPILVKSQAMDVENSLKMKEAGITDIGYNLEVWDPRLFDIICPGKAKNVGRGKWMERMVESVEVFGKGHVTSSFVVGVEMLHPQGFKSEDEAAASVLEGWDWMMSHGIRPSGTLIRCAPGTEFAGMPSPRTEYWLRLAMANRALSAKHGMPLYWWAL